MSGASHNNAPIGEKRELVEWFEQGSTPAAQRLIGVEHEKPPFYLLDNSPVSYEGRKGRAGIKDFIDKMIADHAWEVGDIENGNIIDIHKNRMSWTFEPGLQMETGGAPLSNVHENATETETSITEALHAANTLGIGMLATGYHPTHAASRLPMMPKSRYETIRQFAMASKFPNALDLMFCTATAQANLGYQNESDMVKMLRVSLSLQPIAVALFATSPFSKGQPTGYQSYRSHKLVNNFGGRYGFMLPIAFDEGFGFEMYVDYALKTMPMMGVYQGPHFVDAKGAKFQDFIDGKLDICEGRHATLADWENHLNTIWPEVRLRRFLEMRGTDNGPAEMIKALPAFWAGLLYDSQSLDAAYEMVKDWSQQDRDYLRIMTPQHGLQTPFMGTTVQDIAKNCLALSEAGLKRRAILDIRGNTEAVYLEPLHEIAGSGLNWAQRMEAKFHNEWGGNVAPMFYEMRYGNNPSVLQAGNTFKYTIVGNMGDATPAPGKTPRKKPSL